MFRQPRGSGLARDPMTSKEVDEVLSRNMYCTMSLNGPEGYPSGVPMNYAWDGTYIYLHCNSMRGEKLELLRKNPKVCITVFETAQNIGRTPLGKHRSVMCFGDVEILSGGEAVEGLQKIALGSGMPFKAEEEYITKRLAATVTLRVTPVHLTGRQVIFGALPGAKPGDPAE